MAAKRLKRCPKWKSPFAQCERIVAEQSVGHDGDCVFSPATLSPREEMIWLNVFSYTGNASAADDRVRDLRIHLASDEPSLMKNPHHEDPNA